MITRHYYDLEKFLKANKVLLILGPRQAGKTTLMEEFLSRSGVLSYCLTF
jgi:predicted AAA+ superfamily ATPase